MIQDISVYDPAKTFPCFVEQNRGIIKDIQQLLGLILPVLVLIPTYQE